MIYMVECAFTDPVREDAWNAWYDAEKLAALLSVPGFRASQRFGAITDIPAPYLAIHSIRDAAVLDQPAYRDVGGGTFSGWDDLVTAWDRNLFTAMETAPEVAPDQYLIVLDDPAEAELAPGAEITWLDIAGLDRTVDRRGLAVIGGDAPGRLVRNRGSRLRLYAPLGPRHLSPRGIDG